jgi:Na+-translocating ferredoxin:NAD+ oxidoreductase subunit C
MIYAKNLPRGGIDPPNKSLVPAAARIGNAAVPSIAVIPMLQHAGKPAVCLVKPGDKVREGMLIGKADGTLSANVHSSIPGTVVELRAIEIPGMASCQSVVIELGGEFEKSGRRQQVHEWGKLSRADLLARIHAAGIVGLGGGLMPTHVKLAVPSGRTVSLLVANGVDCEPLIEADRALLREKPAEIVEGIRICQAVLGAARVVLAIGEHTEEIAPTYEQLFVKTGLSCDVALVPSRYPQGHEQLVLASVDGAYDGAKAAGDAVVLNVATLYAVYEAVVLEKPLIERVLTVTGSAVAAPRNLKARVGTRLHDLFDECGGFLSPPAKIVMGGPMRGVSIDSLDLPVCKATGGVVAFSRAEAHPRREWPCIRCGSCIAACPWDLSPTLLYKLIGQGNVEEAEREGLDRCTECGCCAYSCPSHIPLVDALRAGKNARKRSADG